MDKIADPKKTTNLVNQKKESPKTKTLLLLVSCLVILFFFFSLLFSIVAAYGLYNFFQAQKEKKTKENYGKWLNNLIIPSLTPLPSLYPTITPLPSPTTIPIPTPIPTLAPAINNIESQDWGVAKQIDEHTWSMKVNNDDRMTTPQEMFEALNVYRQKQGKSILSWDQKLADYAQNRAQYLNQIQANDNHQGFINFITNEDGYHKLGFYTLGENSAFGYQLYGVHFIEWIFAGDEPHNKNQLDSRWSHVGIGVNGLAVDLIFGGEKM